MQTTGFFPSETRTSFEPLYDGVSVVVPAHNEAATIASLCEALQARGARVFVVNDGSTDATARLARAQGATVLTVARRRGKGAALRTGLTAALANGPSWIGLIDGDRQHAVEDLDRLVLFARRGGHDLVIGQRAFSPRMPWLRRLTNRLMSTVLRWWTAHPIADSQCGLRVLSASAAARLLPESSGYEVKSEMIIRAARERMSIGLLPITTIYRPDGKSSIHPVRDTVRWLRFLWRMAA